MAVEPAMQAQDIIEKVVEAVRARVPAAEQALAKDFIRAYFAGTAADDLGERAVEDLYGAALSHVGFARSRRAGETKLRAYNPDPQQHGWQSTHTIVEIVTDDMPFLVDSVRMAINQHGLTCHLIIHPVLRVRRDPAGQLADILEHDSNLHEGMITEAVMHIEVDRQTEAERLAALREGVERALRDVRAATEDWRPMRERLAEVLTLLAQAPPPLPADELDEGREFLSWTDDNHFSFLGFREYRLHDVDGEAQLESVAGSGLGLLRDAGEARVSRTFAQLPPALRALAREPSLLIVTKANRRSTVHRPGHMDYIGVRRFDDAGKVIGEWRFLGLFTSAAYNRSPREIPLLREKVDRVIRRAGYPPKSHAAKALVNILETFPRELLFQVPEEELFATSTGILHLQERQRIRLFVHRDRYGRFYSCIVYVPRERFNTQVRLSIQDILAGTLDAEDCEFTVLLSESVLARLYFVFRVKPGEGPSFDVRALEGRLREVTRSWSDNLYGALTDYFGEERGTQLFRRYGESFRADYRETYSARVAVHDIEDIDALGPGARSLAMKLYRPLEAPPGAVRFKLFRREHPIPLSEALPMLERMGLLVEDERPSRIEPAGAAPVWLHDLGLELVGARELDLDAVRDKFQETFARIWNADAESDGFNRLVLLAGLEWRDIVVLRAYCKYLRQAGVTFSQEYMEHTLAGNPEIARRLVQLFRRRFDPRAGESREDGQAAIEAEILAALDAVANLDEDRILRSFLGLVKATLRTNFFQSVDGGFKSYVSFKFDPKRIPELPAPRPRFEIFVYSPRVEGVHLRGGSVARGGLRWSDRREDFRTEVLGLVKAQMIKNAVIVPVGSKGGFYPKHLPAGDREAMMAEGIACYRTFIRGLLDVTDNLVESEVVPPADVVRHDGDDPYLVVAADKGTATFSDIANGIAGEYGYWLGDAFASGGSQGYDHKKMGITARGAWESVKRHFRELGTDIQRSDFTVAGIGDMSGDVFGNGMLLSRHIRVLGAFNHLHIFLDPDPDPARSFAERERLFSLPRSTWDDYDRAAISEGGGVFARSAKTIALSSQVREALGTDAESLPPNELIRALLRAPVDLLWNGGIGTYVKSPHEHDGDVGDRTNDAVRVDASTLRCRVVGEGGNLGFTQRGRIEFAARGGRINTDAIDNAGGVDCSDHEVNIKVLLNGVVAAGDMTVKQRNTLLAEMTDEVSALVLRNNYLQTQALSLAVAQAPSLLDVHARLIRQLERDGELDRAIEYLPDNEAMTERAAAHRGLTSPELSVVMAYVKIALFSDLLESDLPRDPALRRELADYFPEPLRERFAQALPGHRLSREIISTVVANEVVNRAGMSFVFRLGEETGGAPGDVARAYLAARDAFDMEALWSAVEALDNVASAQAQIAMLLEGRKLVERASRWMIRNRPRPLDVRATVERYASGIGELGRCVAELAGEGARAAIDELTRRLVGDGVPEALATRVGSFNELYSALDIVEVSEATGVAVREVAELYFGINARLELNWLRDRVVALPRENRWQTLARAALRDDLYAQEAAITADVLRVSEADRGADERIAEWLQRDADAVARCRQVMADLKAGPTPDFTMLSVAMREIRALRRPEAGDAAPPRRAGTARARAPAKSRARKAKRA